jgi:hypothetical protein
MTRRISTYGVVFAAIGAVVATALLAYDYLFLVSPSGWNTATEFEAELIFTLCPPSIALMALEKAHGAKLVFTLFLIVVMNAGLYGVGGCLVGGLALAADRIIGKRGPKRL